MSAVQETCVLCGASDLFHKRQRVAGDRVAVCRICAAFGRAALDARVASLKPGDQCGSDFGCLHLTAMEVEREMSLRGDRLGRRERRTLRAIESMFRASAYRMACACISCTAWQQGVDSGPVVFTDIFDTDEEADGYGMVAVADADLPGVYRPCVDSEAVARAVKPPEGFMSFGAIAERMAVKRAREDAASFQHWSMVKKYGPGIRDGDLWLARDGRIVPLQDSDRVLPMTEADYRALMVDHLRAAKWRGSCE